MSVLILAMKRREHYKRLQFLEESLLLNYDSPFTKEELERKIRVAKRNIEKLNEEMRQENGLH